MEIADFTELTDFIELEKKFELTEKSELIKKGVPAAPANPVYKLSMTSMGRNISIGLLGLS